MNNFLFLLPVMGQPRYAKRIDMLQAEGVKAKVLYFERDYHVGRKPNCEVSCLGKIEHGRYFKRVFTYLAAMKEIRNAAKNAKVIYSFELDLAFLAFLVTIGLNIKRVVEIGDIREVQTGSGFISNILRTVEKYIIKRCSLLVVTAPKFYTEYYQKWLKVNVEHLVIENKLDQSFMPPVFQSSNKLNGKIAIGYFGLLRCQWSAETLYKLAKEHENKFSIVLAGKWMLSESLLKSLTSLDNVTYIGEYKSPGGLFDIYNEVTMVWSCYEPLNDKQYNLHWAKTNRFYEALCFKKPLVSRKGSSDGDFVFDKDIGISLEKNEKLQFTLQPLLNINAKEVRRWCKNLDELDASYYFYIDEAKKLTKILRVN